MIYKAIAHENNLRSVDIARELGVTKASVSRMIKLLVNMGLLSVEERGKIGLTQRGSDEGSDIHRKISQIHSFFADYLELDEFEATESAYLFLSEFSELCVNNLIRKKMLFTKSPNFAK